MMLIGSKKHSDPEARESRAASSFDLFLNILNVWQLFVKRSLRIVFFFVLRWGKRIGEFEKNLCDLLLGCCACEYVSTYNFVISRLYKKTTNNGKKRRKKAKQEKKNNLIIKHPKIIIAQLYLVCKCVGLVKFRCVC